jgi:hypothetical protein
MDFGSASELGVGQDAPSATPLTTAPEVLAGAVPTASADQYSLGVLLYRLVTLHYPVEAATLEELTGKLERNERVALRTARPDLPPAFVQVVERATAPDPKDRFPDIAALERALVATIAESRRRGPLLAVAALVVVAAIAGFLALRSRQSPPPARPAAATAERPAAGAPVAAMTPPAKPVAVPEVEVSLERVTDASREVLRTGDRVDPGDRLSLRLSAREPVYAYVLNEDERGDVYVLFPLRDRGASNPLAAGVPHRLPGGAAHDDLDWLVTSAGGKETFLILIAREALAPVEDALKSLPRPRMDAPVSYAPLVPEALGRLRGVGGVARRPAGDEPGGGAGAGRLRELAQSLSGTSDARGIWIRLIVLENPGTPE